LLESLRGVIIAVGKCCRIHRGSSKIVTFLYAL